jgi:hypothetical protein
MSEIKLTQQPVTNNHTTTGEGEGTPEQLRKWDAVTPKPTTGEWTAEPVIKSDGEKWSGIATIKCGERRIATLNEQEAKGLLTAINAAVKEAYQKGYQDGKSDR